MGILCPYYPNAMPILPEPKVIWAIFTKIINGQEMNNNHPACLIMLMHLVYRGIFDMQYTNVKYRHIQLCIIEVKKMAHINQPYPIHSSIDISLSKH